MASSSSASTPQYRSRFGDTTLTKVFVGGLAWETKTEVLHRYFEPFGEILEAVIINDRITGKSKGYGFVTFRDAEAAQRSVENPNPFIDGRRANCNIAALGRPNPSPPRGTSQSGDIQGPVQPMGAPYYRSPTQVVPPQLMYPTTYGYVPYQAEYAYPQAMYNPQIGQSPYYQPMFGPTTPTSPVPYHYSPYGYYVQSPRTGFTPSPRGLRPQFLPFPATQAEASSSQANVIQLQQPPHVRHIFNSTEPTASQQQPTSEADNESPDS